MLTIWTNEWRGKRKEKEKRNKKRRFISRLQLIVGERVAVVFSPGSIPRVTELPKGREERRRGLRSDPRLLRGVESSRRRCLAINYREGGFLPPLLSLLPLFLPLSFLPCTRDRPTERQINTTQPPQTPLLLQITTEGGKWRKRGRKREKWPISLYLNSGLNPTGSTRDIERVEEEERTRPGSIPSNSLPLPEITVPPMGISIEYRPVGIIFPFLFFPFGEVETRSSMRDRVFFFFLWILIMNLWFY